MKGINKMNLKTVHSYLIILLCITLPMKSSIPEETKKNTEFTELAKKNFNKKHLIPCFMILLHAISILCLKKYLEKEKKESEVDAMIEIKNLKINIAKDIVHIFFFYSYLYSLGLYLDLKLSNHNTIQITLSLYLITITIYILRKIYIHSKNSNQKNIQDSKEFINKYKKNHEQILIILTKLCKFYNENIEKLLENNKNITIKKK